MIPHRHLLIAAVLCFVVAVALIVLVLR